MTVEQALAHPTWRMGAKITIDSATLMNKGLELIEAHLLFGVPYERIEIVVHPQSIVHGLVRLRDGAMLAHMGMPDMRVPIAYALTHPERRALPAPRIDLDAAPVVRVRAARPAGVPAALRSHAPRARRAGLHRASSTRRTRRRSRRSWPAAAGSSTSPRSLRMRSTPLPASR